MARYGIKVETIATGATANTFITVLAMKFANTAGHRMRLRSLTIGGGGGAPQDLQVSVKWGRTDNSAVGTSTAVNVNTIALFDELSPASIVNAIGKTFTVEPTTKAASRLGGGSLNSRGTLVREWSETDGPVIGKNETFIIEAAPGTATAATLDIALEWDEGF